MSIKISLKIIVVVASLLLVSTDSFAQSGPTIVQFTATPSTVTPGQTVTLFWNSINTSFCRATNGWAGQTLPAVGQGGLSTTSLSPGLYRLGLRCCAQVTCVQPPCPESCSPEAFASVTVAGQTSSNLRIVLTPPSLTGTEGSSVSLTARLENCGGGEGCFPVAGERLNFRNFSGISVQFSSSSMITNNSGNATVTVSLPPAGSGLLSVTNDLGTARGDPPVLSLPGQRFVSVEPNPLTVPLNGQTQATVRVRTQLGNLLVSNESFGVSYANSSPGAVAGPPSISSNSSGTASLPLTGIVGGVGRFFVSTNGLSGSQQIPVSVISSPVNLVTVTVTELYNRLLNHYFITANDLEVQSILSDPVLSQQWSRTGDSFRAWPRNTAGFSNVCRFGGNSIALFTNSTHFYTVNPDECSELRQGRPPGWNFEENAFAVLPPINGACPSNSRPVYRTYNRRINATSNNHRFTTSLTTHQQMVALGHANEGVAFCVPLN